jgi:hypothetical protein
MSFSTGVEGLAMFGRWIGLSIKSIAVLKPVFEVAAKEGSPALSEKLQRVRDDAVERRAQQRSRRMGQVRQVLDPTLAAVSTDDWSKVPTLLAKMSDSQLRLLADAVLERHPEVSERGGPYAGLELGVLITTEVEGRKAIEKELRRTRKLMRQPRRVTKFRRRHSTTGTDEAPRVPEPVAATEPVLPPSPKDGDLTDPALRSFDRKGRSHVDG